MGEGLDPRSGLSERITRLEAQRNLAAGGFALIATFLVGGAVNVMLLTTRLDERYASEHAATASIRTQMEGLATSVSNIGRFDERLTALNASVVRIEAETQRLRESVDLLRADVLRNQNRRGGDHAALRVTLNPRVVARRIPRSNPL